MFPSPSAPSKFFASLPARPPTPPKDISNDVDDALRFLEEGHDETTSDASHPSTKRTSRTPPSGSPSLLESRGATATKKVDFSPYPTIHRLAQPALHGSFQGLSPRHRLSAHAVKPLKSILKATNENLPLTPDDLENRICFFSPQEPGSFRKMMQSVLNQLAAPSRDGRRDAYLAINGALKAYEGVPEPQAMIEKMDILQQFISRDMVWKDQNGKLDSAIVSQALNLTCAILHHPRTSPALDDDFRTFVVDRSIAVMEQADVPKAIIKIHAYLLSQQRFASHIVTAARADRLVTALQTVEERCSGNSIVSARLIAYQRLIEAQPNVMIRRMRDWIEHIFHGMLSNINDTRVRAIETCTHAGLYFGNQPQAATIMYELCERSVGNQEDSGQEQEQTYGDYFTDRLNQMALDKEQAVQAPQVWGAVILLFRHKKRPIEKWPKFKQWLQTIQRCLNSGDIEIKQQANIAWNKLVFAVMPDASTDQTLRSMLRVPIVAGLEKRGSDKLSQQQRQLAMDSYCNLLHYGMRPTLSHEELDKAWELYVESVLGNTSKGGVKVQVSMCRILDGLLKKSDGVWNANAANMSESIKPDELPRLDAKWVRSRIGTVLSVLEPILQSSMCSSPDSNRYVDSCWKLLLQAVAEAGTQEVKTSTELKEALAQLTNFFRRLWHSSAEPAKCTDGSVWIRRYEALLETAVDSLGAAHFVEDILAKTSADDVEAAPTPSHRMSKHSKVAYSPFVFLLALYYQPTNALQAENVYTKSASWFLDLLAGTKGTVSGTLGLLHRSMQVCCEQAETVHICRSLWPVVAATSMNALSSRRTTSPQHDAQVMGVALKSSLNILSYGLRYAQGHSACLDQIQAMYQAICQAAKYYAHDGGVALGVMEPFAKTILDMALDIELEVLLQVTTSILENGVWPKSRQELERDRKALWAISLDPPRSTVFDPFEHVYALANSAMQRGYDSLDKENAVRPLAYVALPQAITAFAQRCPQSMSLAALRKLQPGFATWVQDKQRMLFPKTATSTTVYPNGQMIQLWSQWALLLEQLPKKDSLLLQSLEILIAAGFSSPSREIVNKTIASWNATFGQQQALEYPVILRPILRARRAQAEIVLPNFPKEDEGEEEIELPEFVETQGFSSFEIGLEAAFKSTPRPAFSKKHRSEHATARNSPAPLIQRSNVASRRSRLSTTPKVRLRHDDSQIDFAPINTSPKLTREESQFLTEHQREVKARQHGDAQMFPDLSSSPMAQSTAKSKSIAKKLDFAPQSSTEPEEDATITTPTGLVDGNPMSDDLPSSPTPKAGDNISKPDEPTYDSDEDDNETIVDPPSSPPREDEDTIAPLLEEPLRTEGPPAVLGDVVSGSELPGEQPAGGARSADHCENEGACGDNGISDLASDTVLPTEQLEREAEAAAAEAQLHGDDIEATTVIDSEATEDGITTEVPTKDDQEQHQGTPSRIENSMIEPRSRQSTASADVEAPSSGRGFKKRKRNFETVHTSKKKTKLSPFKSMLTRLTGSRQEDDDDMEDEIVVASSQTRSPSKSNVAQVSAPQPPVRQPLVREKYEDFIADSQEPEPATAVPVKRKPGRPRKTQSQPEQLSRSHEVATSGAESVIEHKRGRKRRASLSSIGTADEQGSTSLVADTPAPSKSRKSVRLSKDDSHGSSTSRRRSAGLAKQAEDNDKDAEVSDDDLDVRNLDAGDQTSSARIAEPQTILERLRSVYRDFKGKVFGSKDEERQFDDLLFDFRREVHEAGRRGYAQDE